MLRAARAIGRGQITSLIFTPAISIGPQISVQKRTIYSKYAVPDYDKHKPAPWPYRERGYKHYHQFLDFGVSKRLGENSKLIIVEGNTGSGKSKFAKELADSLGFYHIPDPNFDQVAFIDSYGDDQRLYYHLLPENTRRFDTRMFYEQPTHRNVARMQLERLQCRAEAYLNGLAHILNTGQGVVLERCFRSDKVFVEAMHRRGYLSDCFRWYYHKWLFPRINEHIELEAHLVVYLDCPVDKCLENIKKNHKPWEWKNEVMGYSYLEDMEKGLKDWLKEYSRHAEIVTYDWKDGGDARTVAEDLERIDLDEFKTHENEKFETWHLFPDEDKFNDYRMMVTSQKDEVLQYFLYTHPKVEELWFGMEALRQRKQAMDLIYGKYAPGYRVARGDSVWDMITSEFRDQYTNKKWVEYAIQDHFHTMYHDLTFNDPGDPEAPTFPEEFLQPRSPYKSDGGCMGENTLFMENGQVIFVPH